MQDCEFFTVSVLLTYVFVFKARAAENSH